MRDEIPQKFLNDSLEIIKKNTDLEERLKSVMGKVADAVVRDKYVNSDKKVSKSDNISDAQLD